VSLVTVGVLAAVPRRLASERADIELGSTPCHPQIRAVGESRPFPRKFCAVFRGPFYYFCIGQSLLDATVRRCRSYRRHLATRVCAAFILM